ncbi:UDP-3-O-(3-hydroxymyristoyl)glucosamine N-acyltransferase [bacterium]|jgi:UDP-3-O-[3-hydroxymyristoyl] glucosamine N-acyltransferase|nr:UDP-3-O-(3-hydroxymyristoyl)glucosamine N-acyltransferase [bacterium]
MVYTLGQICEWSGAIVANGEEPEVAAALNGFTIERLAPLRDAGPRDAAFFFSKSYEADLRTTRAGLIITGEAFVAPLRGSGLPQWKTSVFLSSPDPYSSMAKLSREVSRRICFHDHQQSPEHLEIHPTAVVDPSAKVGPKVRIGAHVVIEAGAEIGEGSVLYPRVYVGPKVRIGSGTVLFPGVTLYWGTVLGDRCRIHAGAVIGADGFGYAPLKDPATRLTVDHQKIWHLGRVIVGDDVEIGANSTVDRGTLGDTLIGDKVKIDNQVQVGHNVELEEGVILCGASGVAGSASIGKFTMIGAQAGLGNHVRLGAYSTVTAYGGVTKDFPDHSHLGGFPARVHAEQVKILALQQRLLKERGRRK